MKVVFVGEPKFIVKESTKTVVCIMKVLVNAWKSSQNNVFGKESELITVKGFSKCHPEDKFDEVIGKRIAESRAKKEAYREGRNYLQKILDSTVIYEKDLKQSMIKLINFGKKEKSHIEELMNSVKKD